MKKLRLVLEPDYDFLLYALSSHVKDYRLAWSLNKLFNWNFTKQDEFSIKLKKDSSPTEFSLYTYEDEALAVIYRLLANRSASGILIPELKHIDYFVMIEGNLAQINEAEITQQMKKVKFVNATQKLNPNDLKSKQNLIIE